MRPIDGDALKMALSQSFNDPELVIDDAPTLDLAPVVHGEWVEQEITPGDVYYTCSVCKEDWFIPDGTPAESFMHYCPRCGAKMAGGKKDD